LELEKKKILLALFKIQNGGDIQYGRHFVRRELEFGMWKDFEMRCTVGSLCLFFNQPAANRFFNAPDYLKNIEQTFFLNYQIAE
jgi:hypothetical protein